MKGGPGTPLPIVSSLSGSVSIRASICGLDGIYMADPANPIHRPIFIIEWEGIDGGHWLATDGDKFWFIGGIRLYTCPITCEVIPSLEQVREAIAKLNNE